MQEARTEGWCVQHECRLCLRALQQQQHSSKLNISWLASAGTQAVEVKQTANVA